jgi:hypothetical protein
MDSILTYPENKGLTIGTKAPNIKTEDIYDNEIHLEEILNESKGILIDFFRGAW